MSTLKLSIDYSQKGFTPINVILTDGKANVDLKGENGRASALDDSAKVSKLFILNKLKTICSTGSPLSQGGFKYIYQNIKNIIPSKLEIETFAIKVERKGEHRFTSTEIARELAGSVFELFPKVKVDLKNPDLKVHIKILNNKCLMYMEIK